MEMHECLSAGCECEREIAISHVKPETIYWLKMSKISDLDNFAIDMGETSTCTYTLCGYSQGGQLASKGGRMPPPAPPPQKKPCTMYTHAWIERD